MKIVPLIPKVQTRTVKPAAESRPQTGVVGSPTFGRDSFDLSTRPEPAPAMTRDEAFILLGRTIGQISDNLDRETLNNIHDVKGNRAVNLLIHS